MDYEHIVAVAARVVEIAGVAVLLFGRSLPQESLRAVCAPCRFRGRLPCLTGRSRAGDFARPGAPGDC